MFRKLLIITIIFGSTVGIHASYRDSLYGFNTQRYNETVQNYKQAFRSFAGLTDVNLANEIKELVDDITTSLGNVAQHWNQMGTVLPSWLATRLKNDFEQYEEKIKELKSTVTAKILALEAAGSEGGSGWFKFSNKNVNQNQIQALRNINDFLDKLAASVQKWQNNLADIKTK